MRFAGIVGVRRWCASFTLLLIDFFVSLLSCMRVDGVSCRASNMVGDSLQRTGLDKLFAVEGWG